MALADILERIAADAAAEAQSISDEAGAQADDLIATAHAETDAVVTRLVNAGVLEAQVEAKRRLAAARLSLRDERVAASDALIAETLAGVEGALVALDDAAYLRFIAQRVVEVATAGEHLSVAPADAVRLSGLAAAVIELGGPSLEDVGPAADLAAGVLVLGDRMLVEVSPRAVVAERREEFVLRISAMLFGGQSR